MIIDVSHHTTPVGPMTAVAHAGRLALLEFSAHDRAPVARSAPGRPPVPSKTWKRMGFVPPAPAIGEERIERWLGEHFAGYVRQEGDPLGMHRRLDAYFQQRDFAAFDDLEIAFAGPPFHCEVWRELCHIPAGATRSYGELAKRLGKPSAARAVGYANSQNPVAIVVPCHRVIGSNGTLTGYAGGLERKHWLLVHEGAILI